VSLVEIIEGIGTAIDAIGVAVIAGGALLAVFMTIGRTRREDGGVYDFFRRRLGHAILLGLEFSVAADIIRTVGVTPSGESVAVLAGIVLIRTFLSFSPTGDDGRMAMAAALHRRHREIPRAVSRISVRLPEQLHARGPRRAPSVAGVKGIVWDESIRTTTVHRAPAGVVSAITPWNAPLKMVCMKAGAAMAAGCTVVLKGTEFAPLSSFIFAEAAAEAGVPDGVFNLVSGTGPEIGEAIVTHPLVDLVSLTGSVRAGRWNSRPSVKHLTSILGEYLRYWSCDQGWT
jgi:uncharacterized membrane protein